MQHLYYKILCSRDTCQLTCKHPQDTLSVAQPYLPFKNSIVFMSKCFHKFIKERLGRLNNGNSTSEKDVVFFGWG